VDRSVRQSSRTWSLKARLTLLYTCAAAIILVAAGTYLYWTSVGNFRREDDRFLVQKIHVLRQILREAPHNPEALEEEVRWEGGQQFSQYYARVLDTTRHTVEESPGMSSLLPAGLFPSPVALDRDPRGSLLRRLPDGRVYLLMAAWAGANHRRWLLQVALGITHEDAAISDYGRKLVLALLVAVLLSAAAGHTIASRGLRPLDEITRAAERVTAAQLHERVGPARWPRELVTLARAFDSMLERLEGSFERLSRFSADLAHELRTPVNTLMGEAEVALARARTPQEYREVVESSLEEYARLARMIDGLFFLARAENQQAPLKPVMLDARAELDAVRDYYEAMAEEQGVALVCSGTARLFADPDLFRRAVSNLISNALRYTPSGGRITISSEELLAATIVAVTDTGAGIPPENLPRIFDRFYRADPSRSEPSEGSGLGLSIVKAIVELHGGSCSAQSTPCEGTTISLCFPRLTPVGRES